MSDELSSPDLRQLALKLDETVRAVPGVEVLFSADPALLRSMRELVPADDPLPLISVKGDGATLIVEVSIGVHGAEQAPATAAAVSEVIRAALAPAQTEISVRISRVIG